MAKQKETISMMGMVKLNPTVQFVTDGAIEALERKPRTLPSFEGGPVAVIGVKNPPKLKAPVLKVYSRGEEGCRGATNCALESYKNCACHPKLRAVR